MYIMCVSHMRGLVYGSGACAPATFVGPGGTSVVVFPVEQAPRQGDNQPFTAVRRVAIPNLFDATTSYMLSYVCMDRCYLT